MTRSEELTGSGTIFRAVSEWIELSIVFNADQALGIVAPVLARERGEGSTHRRNEANALQGWNGGASKGRPHGEGRATGDGASGFRFP